MVLEVSDAPSFPKSLDVLAVGFVPENDVLKRLRSPGLGGSSVVGVGG